MNLIAAAEEPLWVKIAYFVVVFAVFAVIVFFTVSTSTAFAESFEIIANERASSEAKLVALMRALASRLRKR
jgi:sensor histidine kinase regulating citrate/malate metabolism